MNATRSLFAVLILLLAAVAWYLLRAEEPDSDPGAAGGAEQSQAQPAGAIGAADLDAVGDGSLTRAEASGTEASAAERANAAAAAGQAMLRLKAVDHAGRAVPTAWVSTQADFFGQGDFEVFSVGMPGRGEAERITGGADGRIETAVPASSSLIVEVGGPAQQTLRLRLDPLARGEILDLGTLTLQDGGEIAGQVRAPDGAAVAGAQVSLRETGSRSGGFAGPQRRATSDERGEYRFSGLLPGAYQLEAEASGYAPAASVQTKAEAGVPAEAMLHLREGRVLRGQIVDRDRRPVAGAEIFVGSATRGGGLNFEFGVGATPQQKADAVSGADGRFMLRGLPEEGNARLTAQAQGYASGRATVNPSDSEALITLTPALTLAGKLVNEKGAGVSGLEVLVERADDEFDFMSFWSSRSAISGPDGSFSIGGLDAGVWRVLAHTATHSTGDLRVDLAQDVDDVVARLEPAAVFAVIVTESGSGMPVPGAVVMIEPQEDPAQGFAGHGVGQRGVRVRASADGAGESHISFGGENRGITDADGVAAFTDLAEGRYSLRLSAEGFARQQLDFVRERGPQRSELALLPGANLRAVVQDGAGAPLPGVRVVATPKIEGASSKAAPLTRTTDAAGRAVFTGMQPGIWTVDYEAAAAEGGFSFSEVSIGNRGAAKPASSRTGVEAMLVPGDDAEVLLRATEIAIPTVRVTRRGKPLGNAQVRLEPVKTANDPMSGMIFGDVGGTRTLPDGSARLQPVAPGEYDVVVMPGEGLPQRRERATVMAGEQKIDVDVRGGRISGRAESSTGELRKAVAHLERAAAENSGGGRRPMAMRILLTDDGEGPNVSMSGGPNATRVDLDSSGRYVFEEVPPGDWTVRITAPGHAAWSSEKIVLADEQERDLGAARLSAGGTLRGVHRAAAAGDAAGGFGANILILMDEQGRQSGMTQPRADGSYEFRDLANGTYTLIAPPGYRSDPIEMRDGATVTHDVPNER